MASGDEKFFAGKMKERLLPRLSIIVVSPTANAPPIMVVFTSPTAKNRGHTKLPVAMRTPAQRSVKSCENLVSAQVPSSASDTFAGTQANVLCSHRKWGPISVIACLWYSRKTVPSQDGKRGQKRSCLWLHLHPLSLQRRVSQLRTKWEGRHSSEIPHKNYKDGHEPSYFLGFDTSRFFFWFFFFFFFGFFFFFWIIVLKSP